MSDCDRCGTTEMTRRVKLRNPKFDNGTISKLVSRMVVCKDCHEAMKDSEKWQL